MPTVSFAKNFHVDRKSADTFVEEMEKRSEPTLRPDFQSHFTYLHQDKELRDSIHKALGKPCHTKKL